MECCAHLSFTYWSLLLTFVVYSGEVSALRQGESNPNPQCEFPPINFGAQDIDVLGDREKGNICALPRPWTLCEKKGKADATCKKIAQAVGGVSDISCSHEHICKFRVKHPVQHPNTPGDAYVSLCVPPVAGVIFPCIGNDLRIVNPFYNVISDEDTENEKPFQPILDEETCGEVDPSVKQFVYNPRKIIKPQKTLRGQFPWQVALYRKREHQSDEFYDLFCGGSVIAESYILTAAHCFIERDFKFKAILGDFDKTIEEDGEQEFPIYQQGIYVHENYNPDLLDFDIAIIRLRDPIVYTKYVQPICLPSERLPYIENYNCLISGWGHTDRKTVSLPDKLQAASVPTIAHDSCKSADVYGNMFKGHMLCAGSIKKDAADTCQGDSGGPLICSILDDNNNAYQVQIGIVSWGQVCGSGRPGVYANLITLRSWIDKAVGILNQKIDFIIDKKQKPHPS